MSYRQIIDYPFPLDNGQLAHLRLPFDLSDGEIRRLRAMLLTLFVSNREEPHMQSPTICRMVVYRSRTGDYDVPAVINCTQDTLSEKGVEAGHVPALSSPDHVHLTVFTPGKPGMRRQPDAFEPENLPEGGIEALSENVSGCYQEWDIPFAGNETDGEEIAPGTWRWPVRS